MPTYIYNDNIVFSEADVENAAEKSNISVSEYINKLGGKLTKQPVDVSNNKTVEGISKTIINIANNVSKYDPEVNQELGKILYEDPLAAMPNGKAIRGVTPFTGRPISGFKAAETSQNARIQDYFGKEKFENYQKYKFYNRVDLNNVSEEDLYVAMTNVKNRKIKDFNANIDNDELREKTQLYYEDEKLHEIYLSLKTDDNSTVTKNASLQLDDANYSYTTTPLIDQKTTDPNHFYDKHLEALKIDRQNFDYPYKYNSEQRAAALKEAAELRKNGETLKADLLVMSAGQRGDVRQEQSDIITGKGEVDKVKSQFWDHNTVIYENAAKNFTTDKENYDKVISETNKKALELKSKAENLDKKSADYKSNLEAIVKELNTIADFQQSATDSYNYQVNQLNLIGDQYMSIHSGMKNYDEVVKSLMLNYDFGSRAMIGLEIGAAESVNFVTGLLATLEKGVVDAVNYSNEYKGRDATSFTFFRDANQGMLDYTESVKQYKETAFPVSYRWEDINSSNYGEALSEILANNSFSIAAALTYGGVISYGTKMGINMTVPQATKYLGNTFLAVEGGGYFSRQDLARKSAVKNIELADKMLAQEDITGEKIIFYQNIKDDATRALNQNEYALAFAGIGYGTVAKYAEKFGTMRYVRNFAMANKATGSALTKLMKGSYNVGFNAATEYIEESVTLGTHNFIDIIGGDNKSLLEGLDADFNLNVLVTTLGIQGPSVARNLTMGIYDVGTTQQTKNKNKARALKIAAIQKEIDYLQGYDPTAGTEVEITKLIKEQNKLIEEASLSFSFDMAEVAQMSPQDLKQLFELDRQLRALDQDIYSYGADMSQYGDPTFYKNKLEEVKQKKSKIIEQMDALRSAPEKRRIEELKNYLNLENIQASTLFYYSYYKNTLKLADAMGQKYNVFKDQESMEAFIDKQVGNGSMKEDEAQDLKDSFAKGSYGSESSAGVIIREDNIVDDLNLAPTDFEKSIVAFTLFHEMQHQNDRSINLLTDEGISEQNKQAVKDLEQYIESQYRSNNKFTEEVYNTFKARLNKYKRSGKSLNELTTLLAELQNYGVIEKDNSLSTSLRLLFNMAGKKYFGNQSNFFRFRDARDVAAYVSSFQKGVRNYIAAGTVPERDAQPLFSESIQKRTPEKLIRQIKKIQRTIRDPKLLEKDPDYKRAYKELEEQYSLIALKAISYSPEAGDIPRENLVSAMSVYLPGLVDRYFEGKGKFSTFVTSNIAPKNDTIFEEAKILQIRDSVKLDDPNVKDLAGDINDTANTQQTFVQKIDMFEDFSIVSTKSKDIKSKIKVKKGDTYKDVIDNNAGQVGEIIFDMPAKKIMAGGANLTAVRKVEEGMPIPSEGQSIQRVFQAGENAAKFIKTLPLLNVTRKTADINKVGENIDVSRDIYGRAIGIKGLVMDYFYEDYTDPKATSKDPKVKRDAETSPGGRSLGLSTQTNVKILKPEFRAPTDETIEKFKQDLGITAKNEPNIYNRDIGQFLKSSAKALSIGVSLSGAQRKLQAKTEAAPAAEKQALKQQTADITTAQGRAAFSERLVSVDNIVKVLDALELDTKGIDKLLESLDIKATYDFTTALTDTGREKFFEMLKDDLFPLMPKEFWFKITKTGKVSSDVFTTNNKTFGVETMTPTSKGYDAVKAEQFNTLKDELRKLAFDPTVKFASSIKGANFNVTKSYKTMFGTQEKRNDKKAIKQWNKDVAFIHRKMWESFNNAMQNDKGGKAARAIGTYLKLVRYDKQNWHKLGAQVVGFSKNLNGKKIENEHAMPATQAYLYLMKSAIDERIDFKFAYDLIIENYKLIVLDKAMDEKLTSARTARGYSLRYRMPDDWSVVYGSWWQRYFNQIVVATDGVGIDPNSIVGLDGKTTFATIFNVNASGLVSGTNNQVQSRTNMSLAVTQARGYNKNTKSRGMSTFDFDETLIIDGENFITATKGNDVIKVSSGQWPIQGPKLMEEGYTFDFKDFVNVRGGTEGPLLQKMKNQIRKYGPSNVFVLTARMQESDTAIHGWLKTQGIDIPIQNITGLGNSTGEAKALWMLNKFAEGYNDMYFVDDALPNVKAVKDLLEQLDIKSKVVQAKINFSDRLSLDFNKILEQVTGIDAKKRFSAVKARKRGRDKGKFRFFIPPSHEDFVGLLYNFIGKGDQGNKHRDFFEKSLIRPLNTAFRELNNAKQAIANDYKSLKKKYPELVKRLNKNIKETKDDYNGQDAIRVYLWNKAGYEIPGLSKSDQDLLVAIVKADAEMLAFAENVNIISRQKDYVKPTEVWEIGDIRTDLIEATDGVNRQQFFIEFIENVDKIFSTENLNKIEAAYGEGVREAVEDMIYRIKSGRRRPQGVNKQVNRWLDYLQASIGGVMFFNMRSSILQQLSIVNFINFEDNNLFQAAKAFANFNQYWKDWSMIFNSDMLKQRRGGLTMDVNYQDIASYAARSKQPVRAIIKRLLALGFTPTQISDSMAIASGGATFYRNRVNTYLKEGLSQKEAETKAFEDFQIVAEATQQSARPDMTSSQQNSVLGWFILGFQNVTSQYNRIIKKSASDLINRRISPPYRTQRASDMGNISRILYYGMIQNIVFYTLQTALFAALFNEDEDDEQFLKKRGRVLNGTLDSLLRGSGVGGAIISTIKNMAFAFAGERTKEYNEDESSVLVELLNVSPPMGIKARKIVNAEKTLNYDGDVISFMPKLNIDNPVWSAATNYVEALTTLPANRLYRKTQNLREAADRDNSNMQRIFNLLGWSKWNLGIEDKDLERIRKQAKQAAKRNKKSRSQKMNLN